MEPTKPDLDQLEFWPACQRLLELYPQRPNRISSDTDIVRLTHHLRALAGQLANRCCPGQHWRGSASVGKGTWTHVPWLAIFDQRETTGAQKGVYPVIHFSCDDPVGLRLGLGVAVTEFKDDPTGKASEVHQQLTPDEIQTLVDQGFTDVITKPRQ